MSKGYLSNLPGHRKLLELSGSKTKTTNEKIIYLSENTTTYNILKF